MPAKTTRTLGLTCPFCLDATATVKLDLNALDVCTCTGCDEEFSPSAAAAKFAGLAERWGVVVTWIGKAPTI
jgi:hypothetical protein